MNQKEETNIQNKIRAGLSQAGCKVFRCTVGNFYTKWGQEIKIGTVGHSDLYGVRPGGKAFFVEVKTPIGAASKEQLRFVEIMKNEMGAYAGFARSVEDALKIVFPEKYQ